ncbi:clathrin coat assembly protein AP180-like isoform X2 [Ursus arctos]|uniref:clathrin coat assembly protein AP180-like isoform X2 n=1 Tax=Ursus arctos TaxID=9644 RepID=UPI00254853D3|nr:clathrin coat assembly protein AP180-like isoform X2 [Ursus arctos]
MKVLALLVLVAVSTFLVSGQSTTSAPSDSSTAAPDATTAAATTAATTTAAATTAAATTAAATKATRTPFNPIKDIIDYLRHLRG